MKVIYLSCRRVGLGWMNVMRKKKKRNELKRQESQEDRRMLEVALQHPAAPKFYCSRLFAFRRIELVDQVMCVSVPETELSGKCNMMFRWSESSFDFRQDGKGHMLKVTVTKMDLYKNGTRISFQSDDMIAFQFDMNVSVFDSYHRICFVSTLWTVCYKYQNAAQNGCSVLCNIFIARLLPVQTDDDVALGMDMTLDIVFHKSKRRSWDRRMVCQIKLNY